MKTDLFFVYGTLKIGGYFAKQFNDFRINSEIAEISGYNMYNLGTFPGIKPGKGIVVGELHEYTNTDKVTKQMDLIEGYYSEINDGMYLRKRVMVKTNIGQFKEANTYIFNMKIPKYAKKLVSGFWELSTE